jgi:hypothetical protein
MQPTLNKLFFDENDKLLKNVSDNFKEIAKDVLESLDSENFDLNIFIGLILTGSMLTVSWDEHSDLDLHILYDASRGQQELTANDAKLLWLLGDKFNRNEYKISNAVVEVYFQDINEEHHASAIYNIMTDEWISKSDTDKLVFTDEIKDYANQFTIRVDEFVRNTASDTRSIQERLDELNGIREDIYLFRRIAGEKYNNAIDFVSSFENMVFKWVKRSGTLDKLNELIKQTTELKYND